MSNARTGQLRDISLLLASLGTGAVAVATLREPWAKASNALWPWLLLIFAGFLGGIALLRMDRWLPDSQPATRPQIQVGSPNRKTAIVLLVIAGLLTAWVVIRLWPDYHKWHGTVAPWIASLVLVIAAGWILKTIGQPAEQDVPPFVGTGTKSPITIPSWLEIALLLAIAALAIFLRTYRLDFIPSGIYVDETNGALDALQINDGLDVSPFGTGWYGTPNGYLYYMALIFKQLGTSYASLKAVSLIPAIITVLAIYPLGRLLFGPLGGLASMLLMAVSRWHLSLSRWGWNELAPLPFQIGATYFLIRGLRERRAIDFVLGGLLSGLMMYTYLSSRLALATLGVFILYFLFIAPGGIFSALKKHWQGLLLFVFAACIAVAPIAVTHITDPFTFNNRVDEISVFREIKQTGSYEPLRQNIQDILKFFHQVGDHQGKHNLPDEPETDPFTGLLFVIGLGYALLNLRDSRRGLLWLWLLFGLAGSVFSSHTESPQSYRALSALPAIALLAGDVASRSAMGLFSLSTTTSVSGNSPSGRKFKTAAIALLAIFLGGSAVWETGIYFGRQANSLAYQSGFNLTENQVAKEVIEALRSDTPVYVSPRFYTFSPLRFLVYSMMQEEKGINVDDNWPFHLARPEQNIPVPYSGHDAIFLLDLYYEKVVNFFNQYYPHTQVATIQYADQIPLYLKVTVPKEDLEAIQGLQATYTYEDGRNEESIVPKIYEDWSKKKVHAAKWQGYILLDRSGEFDFSSQGDLSVQIDGQDWNGQKFLCSGLHSILVTQTDAQAAGLARLGWTTPIGSAAIVPSPVFFHLPEIPQSGLVGTYYKGQSWQGEPVCQKLTPFFLLAWPDQDPIEGAFSARYTGWLRILKPGRYHFRIEADDGARLILDGKTVGEGLISDQPNRVDADLELAAGDHPIQIDYFQAGGGSSLEFYWQPPDENEAPVPPDALIPK
ncbi:MAG TPA: PA14 domain-containing protein, partial [Anaerolineaceae bacterium]|nr:PA14 domain-containing protein [Anaerolineaceae bacterium]